MFISPMLLETSEKPFNSSTHIFEPKIDGHRLILSRQNGETRLWTRNHIECTRQYPELWNVPIDGDIVLDGEVCSIDPDTGAIDFETVMARFLMQKRERIQHAAAHRPVHFVVFDILFLDGQDLRKMPLMQRKSILEQILPDSPFISKIKYTDDRGEDLYELICERKMEGIVAKQKDSRYLSRRSHHWLKVVRYEEVEVFISGYRKKDFGWKAFYGIAKQLVAGEDKNYVYLEPLIKAKGRSGIGREMVR